MTKRGTFLATTGLAILLSACAGPTPVATMPASIVTSFATVTSVAQTTVTVIASAPADPPATRTSPPAQATTTGGPPQGLAIGASVTMTSSEGGATVTLISVERKYAAAAEFADPPTFGNFVVMDVSYEATTGTASYNPYDWAVRDADGHEYRWPGTTGSSHRYTRVN